MWFVTEIEKDFYIRSGSISRFGYARADNTTKFTRRDAVHGTITRLGQWFGKPQHGTVRDYLATIMEDQILPASDEEWHMRLCGLGFMVERESGPPACTIAGLILFGHSPRRYLPQAGHTVDRI